MLDRAALVALVQLVDHDAAAWSELLHAQIDNARQLCEQLQAAVVAEDRGVIHRVSHTLKSSAALFGAAQLASACRALELAADTAAPADLHRCADEVAQQAALAEVALTECLPNL